MKLVRIGQHRIVLARIERGYVAFDDRCTHRGGPLSDGVLACETVQCPWHGSQFDVSTGAVKRGPASEGIRTYGVSERDGRLWLRTPDVSSPALEPAAQGSM
jgi:nitrite reductase/ring-hydroxylating ferredoxin subunit